MPLQARATGMLVAQVTGMIGNHHQQGCWLTTTEIATGNYLTASIQLGNHCCHGTSSSSSNSRCRHWQASRGRCCCLSLAPDPHQGQWCWLDPHPKEQQDPDPWCHSITSRCCSSLPVEQWWFQGPRLV